MALAYLWAAPVSLLGLLLGLLNRLSGGGMRWHLGVLEVRGGLLGRLLGGSLPFSGPVAAITLGHVVLGRDAAALRHTRRHERAHVAQYGRWGLLFLLAYPLAGAWAWWRGGNPYRDNPFEVAARRAESRHKRPQAPASR